MPAYNTKTNVDLAYDANKRRLRAESQIVLSDVMNTALSEMTSQFNTALQRGEILDIGGSRDELKALLLSAANKELAPGDS